MGLGWWFCSCCFGGSCGRSLYRSVLRPFSCGGPYCFVAVSLYGGISVKVLSSIAFFCIFGRVVLFVSL